jgi:AIPR protein
MSSASSLNIQILLDQYLKDFRRGLDSRVEDFKAFELFACDAVLRDLDLTPEQTTSGAVGSGDDGGIDGVYVLLNGVIIEEDDNILEPTFDPKTVPRESSLELWLVQAKRSKSFTETAIDKVSSSLERFFDLNKSEEELLRLYSPEQVARFILFRRAYLALSTRQPTTEVNFAYVSRAESSKSANKKVTVKLDDLAKKVELLLPKAKARTSVVGASELYGIVSSPPSDSHHLKIKESMVIGDGYCALVSVKSFLDFLRAPDKLLKRHIFDWNVRDYEGSVDVNQEIKKSVINSDGPDFWWLNNGVTILASNVTPVGRVSLTMDDVQIVNGLQTSVSIYEALKVMPSHESLLDDRYILVRILVSENEETRDRVIRATNSQTKIASASLRASDHIQRKIEVYLKERDWYYDRRKNYYKNLGKPINRIVSITLLAQSVLSAGLGRPDEARGRPSNVIKNSDLYESVFSDDIPFSVYAWCLDALREIDIFLLSEGKGASERNNLRFFMLMLCAESLAGEQIFDPRQLGRIAGNDLSSCNLAAVLDAVSKGLATLEAQGFTQDQAAKQSQASSSVRKAAAKRSLKI